MTELVKFILNSKKRYFCNVLELISKVEQEQIIEYKKLAAKYDTKKNDLNDNGYSYADYLGDVSHEQEETLNILYKSFIISIIMFMESQLLQLCEHLRQEFGHKFSVYDLSSSGKSRSINYLKKLDVEFPKNKKILNSFNLAFQIRNNLVHADGNVDDKEQWLKWIEIGNAKAKITVHYGELSFTKDYLNDLIDLNEKVCDEISDNWLEKDPFKLYYKNP